MYSTKQGGQYSTMDGTALLLGLNVLNKAGWSVQYSGWDSLSGVNVLNKAGRSVQYNGWDSTVIRSKSSTVGGTPPLSGVNMLNKVLLVGVTPLPGANVQDTPLSPACVLNKAGTGMAVLWVGQHHYHWHACSTRQAQAWQYCGWDSTIITGMRAQQGRHRHGSTVGGTAPKLAVAKPGIQLSNVKHLHKNLPDYN